MTDPRIAVKYEFVRYTRGVGLDLGNGPLGCFPQFIKVRRKDDVEYKASGARFLEVETFIALRDIEDASCDFVVAADVLPEEIAGIAGYLQEWLRCVKDGGHVCAYEPNGSAVRMREAAYRVAGKPAVELVRCEDWPAGGAFIILRRRDGAAEALIEHIGRDDRKTACVVRHGGIGDQIQAAFLLPELKRQGFHVTMLTTEKGKQILEHDPHIDEWFIVDHDHVPNNELSSFWRTIARRFTRFVNLNEAVEGTFLPAPGRPAHAWPAAVRHAMLNRNYAEFAAALAEIPFVPEGRFYATRDEDLWAQRFLGAIPLAKPADGLIGARNAPVFAILWVLSGSSPHKFTPHQDTIIKMILTRLSRAVVIMAGDLACQILEVGWEAEPRVIRTSGELTLRQTLTLAQHVDMVIGPETGVLNSVAYEPEVAKVVLLSHSSRENLTKHWINTASIYGKAPCWPCHQLHYTTEFCPIDEETHAAKCQAGVDPTLIYSYIDAEYTSWAKVQLLRSAA